MYAENLVNFLQPMTLYSEVNCLPLVCNMKLLSVELTAFWTANNCSLELITKRPTKASNALK
jgi:hypothetical protein